MQDLAVAAGYCCTRELLRDNEKISARRLAEKLGVGSNLVDYYRKRLKQGYIYLCPKCPAAKAPRTMLLFPQEDDSTS